MWSLLSALGPYLGQVHAGPVRAASVSEFTCVSALWTQRTLFPWCPPSLLALKLLLPPLPRGFLSPEGRDLVETSHLGLRAQRSLCLCILSGCRFLLDQSGTLHIHLFILCGIEHRQNQLINDIRFGTVSDVRYIKLSNQLILSPPHPLSLSSLTP